jgi:hypothetical protein
MDAHTAQTLIRFGLGRRGAEPPPDDPPAWLAGQLRVADPSASLVVPSTAEGLNAIRQDRADKLPPGQPGRAHAAAKLGNDAWVQAALTTSAPFRERLVWFWGLGDACSRTSVLVITEFGRAVRANGTKGTDHGTGTVAFVLGGAVAGGRVLADWPGLAPGRLFEDRDLQPTTDVRAVAKGLLAQHLRLDAASLAACFPDSAMAAPMRGLVRG